VHYTKFYISFIDVIINNVVIWTISNLNKVWNYLKFFFYILLTCHYIWLETKNI
jgi:hypothetical protein